LLPGETRAATFNVPAPASLSVTSSPSGKRVIYQGATNFKYRVMVSSNLNSIWSLLSSNVSTTPTISIVDSASTNRPMRLYKANSLVTPFFYKGTFSGAGGGGGSSSGSFIVLARTNNTTVFMANNPGQLRGEYSTNLVVTQADDSAYGSFILGTTGRLQFASNMIWGQFTNNSTGTTGTLSGLQSANVGDFSGYAGIYFASTITGHGGTARILLCPDGSFAFYRTDTITGINDGAFDVLNVTGSTDIYLSGSGFKHVLGQFDWINKRFTVNIHELDNSQSFATLNFTEPVF
jgi:hypothetical protein